MGDHGPFSDRMRQLVDIGANNCATRRRFWENLKEFGFEFAFKKYVGSGRSNPFTANLIKECYERECNFNRRASEEASQIDQAGREDRPGAAQNAEGD